MPNPGEELGSLDFESMIGGPLIAVVNAQAQSSMATVDFVKTVGFDDDGKLIKTTFTFNKEAPVLDGDGNPTGATEDAEFELSVPFLTMLPIPTLRVEEATVKFNAKITSVQSRDVTSGLKFDISRTSKSNYLFKSTKLKTSFSYQRDTRSGNKNTRTYTMGVNVRATSDEMPPGLERLLGILENSISEAKV